LAPGATRAGWVYIRTTADDAEALRGSVRIEWQGGGAADITVRANGVGAAEWASAEGKSLVRGVHMWPGSGATPES